MTDETPRESLAISRGGPFFTLQSQIRLIQGDRPRPLLRAAVFVAISWGIPLIISFIEGNAFGAYADKPFLLSLSVWTRFFLSVGIFILMESFVESRVEAHFRPLLSPPLLQAKSKSAANEMVRSAVKRRDSLRAEMICLVIAAGLSAVSYFSMRSLQASSWAIEASASSVSLTWTAYWCFIVSGPLFFFLLGRWIWRIIVLSLFLADLSKLDLKLTVTHPDGFAGVACLGTLPNVFTPLAFAISCVVGAIVAELVILGEIKPASYATVVTCWFLFIHATHALLLLPFSKTLSSVKSKALEMCSAQATQREYRLERSILGRNIVEAGDGGSEEISDASALFHAAKKLPVIPFNRSTLLPVSAAALLPFIVVGATFLPLNQMVGLFKKMLLL